MPLTPEPDSQSGGSFPIFFEGVLIDSPNQLWETVFSEQNIRDIFYKKIRPKGGQGVDRMSVASFERDLNSQIEIIRRKCIAGTYKFTPYLEQLVSKGKDKAPRILSIPTIRDKVVLKILTQFMHVCFSRYVAKDLPNTVIKKIKKQLIQTNERTRYIKLDVKGFYDSIDHKKLIALASESLNLSPFLNLVRRAIQNPTLSAHYSIKERRENRNKVGVPQGLSISNILAEIYISPFDTALMAQCVSYHRFVDDIFMLCETENGEDLWPAISAGLNSLDLKLNTDKCTPENSAWLLDRGIEFLGYKFRGNLVSARDASYRRFIHSILGKITKFKYGKIDIEDDTPERRRTAFIYDLNERITGAIDGNKRFGWIFFFSEITDINLLHQIDRIIAAALSRIPDLSSNDREKIKKVARAYYEANFSPQRGYIHNYNTYRTIAEKLTYLVNSGRLKPNPEATYTDAQIERLFDEVKAANLLKLERDTAMFS